MQYNFASQPSEEPPVAHIGLPVVGSMLKFVSRPREFLQEAKKQVLYPPREGAQCSCA